MAKREFKRVSVEAGDKFRPGYRVNCSKCGTAGEVVCSTQGGGLPPEMLRKKFTEKGWAIADNPLRDTCPKCLSAAKDQPKQDERPKVVPIAFAKAAEKPQEMTREDRRIIFAKLNEVYLDEMRGYEKGWSDSRVADELGTPLAWVREIREENFGAEGLSEDARKAMAQAEEFAKALDALETRAKAFFKELDEMRARFGPIERSVRDVRKAVGGG
jgi:hypothetical protein